MQMEKCLVIEDSSSPLSIIGIRTTLAPFQIAYQVEKCLNIEFYRLKDFLSYRNSWQEELPFSFSLHTDEVKGLTFFLLSNKTTRENNSNKFLDNYELMDYLLIILGRDAEEESSNVVSQIKHSQISLVKRIFPVEEETTQVEPVAQQTSLFLFPEEEQKKTPKKTASRKKKTEIPQEIITAIREDIDVLVTRSQEENKDENKDELASIDNNSNGIRVKIEFRNF